MFGKQMLRSSSSSSNKLWVLLATLIAAFLPVFSFAAGGEDVALTFTGGDQIYLAISAGLGILAIIYGAYLYKSVKSATPGDEKMQEVGAAIRAGALAYLAQQRKMIFAFVILLGVGIGAMYYSKYGVNVGIGIGVCFVLGVAASYIAGYVGMLMAVEANMRTAAAALTSYKKALEVSFRAGGVAGMMTVGLGLVGATLIFLIGGADSMKYLVGFGFGGSLAALFMRVGGGIYTKAADVGADLVGKVEAGIPEDDPRNPAVIADNVGDNVGDCAGMAADVFESYEVTLVAAIVLGAATAAIFPQEVWMKLVLFALMARGVGVVASIIGIQSVKGSDDTKSDPLKAIGKGFLGSAVLAGVFSSIVAYLMMGGYSQLGGIISTTSAKDGQVYARQEQARIRAIAKGQIGAQREVLTDIREEASKTVAAGNKPTDGRPDWSVANVEDVAKVAAVKKILTDAGVKEDAEQVNVVRWALAERRDAAKLEVKDLSAELLGATKAIDDIIKEGSRNVDGFKRGVLTQALQFDPKAPLPAIPSADGFVPVKLTDPRIAALSTNKVTDPQQQQFGAPQEVVSFASEYSKTAPNEKLVVVRIGVKQTVPAQGPTPAKTTEQDVFFGPVTVARTNELINQAKAQNQTTEFTIKDTFPVQFLINKDGDLALGVGKRGEKGTRLTAPHELSQFQQVTYFKASAEEVTKANKAREVNPTSPAIQPNTARVIFVDQRVVDWWRFALCILIGIFMAWIFERMTDYYVSTHKRPTREVAGVASAGPAPMIIQGMALGKESSVASVFTICIALMLPLFIFPPEAYGGPLLSFYGIALIGLGLLATTGFILAMDTFGPISDNAQGVFEMSGAGHSNPEAALAVQRLDAAGNTTKALTKGFAIATAVVAAVALFHSYVEGAKLTTVGMSLDVPEIFIGLLIGGAAPFLFAAFLINAVGRAAFQLIGDVRDQFRNDPGIMAGTSKPDYGRCVAIVTAAAQKELVGPGILAIALPVFVVFGLAIGKPLTTVGGNEYNLVGAQALGGFLAGTILSGQLLAVMLANAGGIWDNAKKLIEDGMHGGKGTEAHKAGVVCDTVGDPFKDTAGPALNPLIKVMNLVALLIAPYVILPLDAGIQIGITAVAGIAILYAIIASKKGSIATEMEAMVGAPETK